MVRKQHLEFTTEFKYLGHMINNTQLDDADINREIKNLFYRCNVLTRRFYSSSVSVKRVLFKSFCLCMYDVALWTNFTVKSYKRMKACYMKCLKIFFGYSRSYSVTTMLSEIDIPDLALQLIILNVFLNNSLCGVVILSYDSL